MGDIPWSSRTDATSETLLAFGNNIINRDGGTHVAGFRSSLTRTLNNYARKNNLLNKLTPSGEDLREGLSLMQRHTQRALDLWQSLQSSEVLQAPLGTDPAAMVA